MAVTISIEANATNVTQTTAQVSANLSAAFKGIQDQMKAMETASGTATSKMITGLQGLAQQATKQTVEQGNLSKAFIQTGQAAQTQLNQFEKLRQQYLKMDQATDQFAKGLSLIRTTLSAFGVTAGIAGLVQFTRSLIDAGLQMDRFQRQLITATGSATSAGQAFQFITAESNRLGQSLQTMVPIFVQLTAATKGTTLEGEKTRALFSALAGAGVAVGLSTEATGRAMVGLIQIISQNAIQLDEFRNQFASQIPGAMRETAKALGEMGVTARGSITEMLSLIEKGKLPVEELMTAVTTGLQAVQAAAPAMADSVEASFNRFSNDVFQLKADIARSGLLELLGEIAKAGGDALFRAGQALGLGTQNISRDAQLAQKDLALVNSAILEYTEVAERARKQGLVPEGELLQIAELTKRRDALTQKLQAYQDQLQAAERAQKTAADITSQQNKAANDEEKRFFEEKKQREAALKAAPGVLQAEGAATAARLKGNLDAIKQNYAEQRTLAIQFAKEQLETAPKDVAAIGQAREAALAQINQREAQAILSGREILADQQLKVAQRVLAAEIAAAGDAQDKIAVLRAKEPELIAKHASEIADINADRAALEAKTMEQGTDKLTKELEKRLKDEERFTDLTQEVQSKHNEWMLNEHARIAKENEKLDEQATRKLERELDKQQRAYERFSDQVIGFLDDTFQRFLTGTLNAVDFFKTLLIRQLSNIAANVIGPFIAAMSASILGGIADILPSALGLAIRSASGLTGGGGEGGTGRSLMSLGGKALSGIGMAKQLMSFLGLDSLTNYIGTGLSSLKETLMVGFKDLFQSASTQAAQAAAENATAASELGFETTGQVGTGAAGAGVSTAATVMGIAGGLAALGAGIYGALNASNNAAKAAYAASAAAGAAAATSAALVSAGVIAAGTGWTGVGLIAAAAAAVIGTVLNMVLKPAGPNLAVGQPAGVDVGVEGGKLVRRGGATSNIMREEGVSSEQTSGVQKALNEGINAAVASIIQTINAVALDPAKLLGPTQDALRFALSEVQTINSASARHMEKDIAEQLKFTQTAIVSNMLDPINMAFEQLIDSDLETQLNRLPATTTGLVDIFKTLNTQLDEMAKGENRDVLGQIQGVREAVARFGTRLAQTAGRTAEQIVNGVIDEFTTMTTTLPALQELSDAGQFSEHLGTFITALNEAMSGGLQALATLKKTQETLTAVGLSGEAVGTQVGRLITAIGEQSAQLSEQIVSMMTMTISELKGSADPGQFSQNLGTFITTLNTMVSGSLQALATLKATQQTLESFGLSGAAVGAQVGRLITMIGEQSVRLSEQIVIGSLKNLADQLQTVVVQPIRIQATTVDSLFTDSLAALNELWLEMQRLDQVGIDTTRIKEQFTTLLGGVLESAKTLLTAAVQQSTFPEFLDVLLSIPDALAKLNPVFERLKALGQAFASVVGPNQQAIAQGEEQLRTPAERMARTAEQMHDLELAIADAGTSAEKALPLYAQLGQAIQANAAAQIDAVQQVGAVIEQITSILDARGTTSDRLARVNQRINTAPGGGQGSIENISNLVTLYVQQLDLLAQLIDTIDAGLSSIDETLRADESVSIRAARLVGATAQPPEVPGKVRALTAEELLQQAGALQDAIGAVRELIAVIEQGLQNIQDILHANETINERATRLLTEVTTGPQPQTVEGLIQLSTGLGDALGAIRALIDLIEQGLQQIQGIMHANETATQRAIRLVAAVPSAQGVTDPAALISIAGQIGEAITAVRAVMDLLQSGIESIDNTLFSLLSVAEQAANLQAKIAAVNTEIAAAGKATPEQLIKLVGLTQQALSVQQQITKSLEATLADLTESIKSAGPPAEEIASTRAQIASLQQLADTGQATPDQLQKLVDLNQELLGLGREFDLLDVQQEALDSLKALAPIIQKQIDDSKLREKALVDNLVLIKTALESYLTVAQSTEAQLLTQLGGIQTALQIALAVAVSTETWLITQLTVIQQWLEAALIGAKITEQQLVLQLLGVQAILQAQRAELAIAQAITLRYLDAQLAQLQAQLLAQYGTTDVQNIIKQIQEWQLDELRDLNKRLKDLFFQQPQAIDLFGVQTAIGTQTTELKDGHLKSIDAQTGTVINKLDDIFKALDKPLRTTPAQSGGWLYASLNRAATGPLGYARGGMVSAILEPGETVFPPPFSPSQTHALTAMNTSFPRMAGGGWMVPGSGSGDHVPALVQDGSFVLNRTASRARGYQGGGVVASGESSTPVVHNHYYNFPNLTIRNKSDLEELKTLLRELERRRLQR